MIKARMVPKMLIQIKSFWRLTSLRSCRIRVVVVLEVFHGLGIGDSG